MFKLSTKAALSVWYWSFASVKQVVITAQEPSPGDGASPTNGAADMPAIQNLSVDISQQGEDEANNTASVTISMSANNIELTTATPEPMEGSGPGYD